VIQQNLRCEGQAWAQLYQVTLKTCSVQLLLQKVIFNLQAKVNPARSYGN
jgi:hypothetical protein